MKHLPSTKGFSLVELLISVAIITLMVVTVSTFQKDIFSLNTTLQSSMNAQLDARHLVKVMITEIREASPSSLGSYPIDTASSTALSFYGDINNDGLKEKIRYFISGTTVKKGIITPTGSPLTYNPANEQVTTVISDFVASSTLPLFQYYPATYSGTTSPMTEPIDVQSIRLVKVTLIIDKDANHSPSPLITSSQVSIRNLKNNL